MSMKTLPLNELQKQVLDKIISGDRMFSYWTPQDFIYVTKFNDVLTIHYKMIFKKGNLIIDYCLTSEKEPLPFKPESTKMILVKMPDHHTNSL